MEIRCWDSLRSEVAICASVRSSGLCCDLKTAQCHGHLGDAVTLEGADSLAIQTGQEPSPCQHDLPYLYAAWFLQDALRSRSGMWKPGVDSWQLRWDPSPLMLCCGLSFPWQMDLVLALPSSCIDCENVMRSWTWRSLEQFHGKKPRGWLASLEHEHRLR